MIKKDLERAGIPYQTEEGTADFHAVGRHTHITELLRNGAIPCKPDDKWRASGAQLARHAARGSRSRACVEVGTASGVICQSTIPEFPWLRGRHDG